MVFKREKPLHTHQNAKLKDLKCQVLARIGSDWDSHERMSSVNRYNTSK